MAAAAPDAAAACCAGPLGVQVKWHPRGPKSVDVDEVDFPLAKMYAYFRRVLPPRKNAT